MEKGDVIGFVGSTGISTGNHLHYEVIKNQKRINPLNFIYGTK
ncbi:M23 family metallopeptidase [Bacteroides xylanisolvens]